MAIQSSGKPLIFQADKRQAFPNIAKNMMPPNIKEGDKFVCQPANRKNVFPELDDKLFPGEESVLKMLQNKYGKNFFARRITDEKGFPTYILYVGDELKTFAELKAEGNMWRLDQTEVGQQLFEKESKRLFDEMRREPALPVA